jgi:hypothetical protein
MAKIGRYGPINISHRDFFRLCHSGGRRRCARCDTGSDGESIGDTNGETVGATDLA